MNESGRAPIGTRVIGWLIILGGALQIAAGAVILILQDDITEDAPDYSSGEVATVGLVAIIFGLVYLLIGRGFIRLSRVALGLGLIFGGLGVVFDAALILANGAGDAHVSLVVSFLINLLVLTASWSGLRARHQLR